MDLPSSTACIIKNVWLSIMEDDTSKHRLHEALATPLVITLDIMKIFNNLHYYIGLGHPSLPKHCFSHKEKIMKRNSCTVMVSEHFCDIHALSSVVFLSETSNVRNTKMKHQC